MSDIIGFVSDNGWAFLGISGNALPFGVATSDETLEKVAAIRVAMSELEDRLITLRGEAEPCHD